VVLVAVEREQFLERQHLVLLILEAVAVDNMQAVLHLALAAAVSSSLDIPILFNLFLLILIQDGLEYLLPRVQYQHQLLVIIQFIHLQDQDQ
jgi:hypothetical protein